MPKKTLYLLVINSHSYGVDHQSFLSYILNTARRKACNYPIIVGKTKYLGKFILGVAVTTVILSYI